MARSNVVSVEAVMVNIDEDFGVASGIRARQRLWRHGMCERERKEERAERWREYLWLAWTGAFAADEFEGDAVDLLDNHAPVEGGVGFNVESEWTVERLKAKLHALQA